MRSISKRSRLPKNGNPGSGFGGSSGGGRSGGFGGSFGGRGQTGADDIFEKPVGQSEIITDSAAGRTYNGPESPWKDEDRAEKESTEQLTNMYQNYHDIKRESANFQPDIVCLKQINGIFTPKAFYSSIN